MERMYFLLNSCPIPHLIPHSIPHSIPHPAKHR